MLTPKQDFLASTLNFSREIASITLSDSEELALLRLLESLTEQQRNKISTRESSRLMRDRLHGFLKMGGYCG